MVALTERSWRIRPIVVFAASGAIGPVLILVLLHAPFDKQYYHALYSLILAITPAWLLGPIEYSYGPVITWFVILGANVLLGAMIGLLITLGDGVNLQLVASLTAAALVAWYSYWSSESLALTTIVLAVAGIIYFLGVSRGGLADA